MVSRDEAGLRQGLTDELAARVLDPEGAGFEDAELALLRALPLMKPDTIELAVDALKGHFDVGEDRGEIGQILIAYGMYRGMHTALSAMGAAVLDDDGHPLDERDGFGVVTMDDGSSVPRDQLALP